MNTRPINFRTLDLNLLKVFDVVMAERNVTRAAARLAMTQPAVSNALRRLRELGIDVPSAVAVVGMDDIDLGKVSTPTLTTVSLLASERGRVAAELLFERLKDPELEPRKVTVMPKLIIRESSVDYLVREPKELTHAAS